MEKKKLLKNKIVDTLPMLYLETVILMVLGQFLGSFILGIPVGIAIVAHPQLQKSAFLNTALMYVIFLGIWAVALFWILIKKRNRPILQAVGTKPQGNNGKYLLLGLVLGFALNGVCILVAWLHHDIDLRCNSSAVVCGCVSDRVYPVVGRGTAVQGISISETAQEL